MKLFRNWNPAFGIGLALSVIAHAGGIAKKIVLPSGQSGYSIRCDNQNVNACYERAGEVCHRGYTIENRETQLGEVSSSGAYIGPGFVPGSTVGSASSASATTSEKGFLITCKDPEVTEYENIKRRDMARAAEKKAIEAEQRHAKLVAGVLLGVFTIGVVVAIGTSVAK